MAGGQRTHPIEDADRLVLDGYILVLADLKPLRKSGWRGFTFLLEDGAGRRGDCPAVRGIHSVGGKDGVRGWMDIEYWEELPFGADGAGPVRVSLADTGMDRKLFGALGAAIPPGGHLMVSYEGDQRVHGETLAGLSAGIPPVATPLGYLLFLSGFPYVKDWYLAEGGMEGPRKLWGEKTPDAEWERILLERTRSQVLPFLGQKRTGGIPELAEAALPRARDVARSTGDDA
ncbi:MAG TPA: DUF1122 family protein [Candidatus Aquicultoraceae bacterium]|nr:DUF1122 family protein [Candidatus Aquicultoraceae bacterium]